MDQRDFPGFQHLATEEDDSRWWADQAALQREAAARKAGNARPAALEAPGADAPAARNRFSPVLFGGGLAVAAAVILAAPLLLTRFGPNRPAHKSAPRVTPGGPAAAPVDTARRLPCYVGGVSVGVLPLVDCAAREGLASDRLHVRLGRPSTDAVAGVEKSGQSVEARAPARNSPPPPPARLVQAPPPARLVPRTPPAEAPTRTARPPSVDHSAPSADRLDDSTLAAVDARREPSREEEDAPSPAESVQAAGDFYTALGKADGERAASLVVPEKRRQGNFSASALDRFYSSLSAPLRITELRLLDNRTVAVRYQFVDAEGYVCRGSSEVDTTVRGGRVLVQGIRTHSRC